MDTHTFQPKRPGSSFCGAMRTKTGNGLTMTVECGHTRIHHLHDTRPASVLAAALEDVAELRRRFPRKPNAWEIENQMLDRIETALRERAL